MWTGFKFQELVELSCVSVVALPGAVCLSVRVVRLDQSKVVD